MNNRKRIRGILGFGLLTVVSVFVLYCIFGAPSLTPEMAMHRAEAREFVGPSKVIAADQVDYFAYDHILLGETDYGYCLFEYRDRLTWWDSGVLTYIGKETNRICFVPDRNLDVYFEEVLPVYAVPGDSRAVSARLTLETQSDRDPVYEGTYISNTELRKGTFFLFEVDLTDMDLSVRQFWKYRFQDDASVYVYISGTATLELFDRDGNLIDTITTEYPALK